MSRPVATPADGQPDGVSGSDAPAAGGPQAPGSALGSWTAGTPAGHAPHAAAVAARHGGSPGSAAHGAPPADGAEPSAEAPRGTAGHGSTGRAGAPSSERPCVTRARRLGEAATAWPQPPAGALAVMMLLALLAAVAIGRQTPPRR